MTTSFTTAKTAAELADLVNRSVGEYWLGGNARLIRNTDSTMYVFEFRGLFVFSFMFTLTAGGKIQILESEGEVNNIYVMYLDMLMRRLEAKNK